MPACKIQCKDDPEAECGTCRHRDKGYPRPGGVEGEMVIKGFTMDGKVVAVPSITIDVGETVLSWLVGFRLWSHWE